MKVYTQASCTESTSVFKPQLFKPVQIFKIFILINQFFVNACGQDCAYFFFILIIFNLSLYNFLSLQSICFKSQTISCLYFKLKISQFGVIFFSHSFPIYNIDNDMYMFIQCSELKSTCMYVSFSYIQSYNSSFFVCIFVLFIVFIYMFVPLLVNEITNILIFPPFSDRIKINKLVHRIIETLCMLKPVTKKEIFTKSTSEKYSHGKLRN